MKIDGFLEILSICILLISFTLSLFQDKGALVLLFMFLAAIIAFIFITFQFHLKKWFKYLHKLYFFVVSVLLISLTILFTIPSLNYDLNTIEISILPLIGGISFCLLISKDWYKATLLRESAVFIKKGKYQEAMAISDKALDLYPEYFGAMFLKADLLLFFGRFQESLELLDKILERKLNEKQEIITLNLKASVLLKLKEYDEAEDLVDELLEEYPKNEYILSNSGYILLTLGYKEEAMNYCEDSLKILDKNLLEFKKSIIKRIKFPKDIRNYELALIWNTKGVIHLNIHQYAEALECFNNVTELNPERGMSWNSKAYALAKLKRYDEALKCVNKSIELNTDSDFLNAAALDSKGYILAGLGKLEEALEYHQNAIKMDPQAEEKYYNKGKTHVKLQQYSEALECFDKALELNPYCEAAKKARNEVLKITNI